MPSRYTLHAVSVNGTLISGISNVGVQSGVAAELSAHDGLVDTNNAMILEMKPQVSFTSIDCAALLGVTGVSGATVTALILYWQKRTNLGTLETGSNHMKTILTASTGMGYIVPTSIAPTHNGRVEIGADIFLGSTDGVTSPLTWSDSQALAGVPAAGDGYTLGPLVLATDPGGSPTDFNIELQSWSLDFGFNVDVGGDDGAIYPTWISVNDRRPVLTANSAKLSHAVTNFPMTGANVAAYFWLRHMSGLIRVVDATATHIRFFCQQAGLVYSDSLEASQGAHGDDTLMVNMIADSSNPAIEIDTTSVIDLTPSVP